MSTFWDDWFKRFREGRSFFFSDIERMMDEMEREMTKAFRDIERFIETIKDDYLKKELLLAYQSKYSIPHFKNVLSYHAEERNRWLKFKEKQMLQRIQKWLEENNLELED